jgi:hypothetical protein
MFCMFCKIFRRAASTLLITTFVALACAAPADARPSPGRDAFDGPSWTLPEGGFFRVLLRWLAKAGGGMDPNGNH